MTDYRVRLVDGKYVVHDDDTFKIVSKHLTYAVASRHCEKLIEQARKHEVMCSQPPPAGPA